MLTVAPTICEAARLGPSPRVVMRRVPTVTRAKPAARDCAQAGRIATRGVGRGLGRGEKATTFPVRSAASAAREARLDEGATSG